MIFHPLHIGTAFNISLISNLSVRVGSDGITLLSAGDLSLEVSAAYENMSDLQIAKTNSLLLALTTRPSFRDADSRIISNKLRDLFADSSWPGTVEISFDQEGSKRVIDELRALPKLTTRGFPRIAMSNTQQNQPDSPAANTPVSTSASSADGNVDDWLTSLMSPEGYLFLWLILYRTVLQC